MRTRSAARSVLAAAVLLAAAVAGGAPDADPILRSESTTDIELDLSVMTDDLVPILLEALAAEDEPNAEMLASLLEFVGVDALHRLRLEERLTKDSAFARITLTLDPGADGGLLAELFAVPAGDCRFAKYVRQDDLLAFMTLQNLPAHLDVLLSQLSRPELAELVAELPIDENGELSIAGFTPRRDLLPLLAGEIDFIQLQSPEGSALSPNQLPYCLAIGAHDGRALRDRILDLVERIGGAEMAGAAGMLRSLPAEPVGDFELTVLPFGGALAVSDEFLVLGLAVEPLKEMLARPRGDLRVPRGRSWAYVDGGRFASTMDRLADMANLFGPGESNPNVLMMRMYSRLFESIGSETVSTTSRRDRLVIESRTEGSLLTGLYGMLQGLAEELPEILRAQREKEKAEESVTVFASAVSTLDAALTAYGQDHDGLFPADPTALVDEGYLEEFPPLEAVPAGAYLEGGYTYHPLLDDEGRIAGYFLFVYGGGEGTGFDVYSDRNLAEDEDFVIEADGYPDGVASFCYDGLALAQMETWRSE